jgi:hypothetical protein
MKSNGSAAPSYALTEPTATALPDAAWLKGFLADIGV